MERLYPGTGIPVQYSSAYSYGGLFAFLFAWKFGGSTMIAFGTMACSILTILNPLLIRCNFYLYWAVQAAEGIFQVLRFVSISEFWSRWSPIQDRSKLIAIGFSGIYAGSMVTYPFCGFLIHKFGWPAAFYCTGGAALTISLLWFTLIPNDPSKAAWISKKELTYITSHQESTVRPNNVLLVWKNILKSKSVLVLCSAKFVFNTGYTIAVTYLPTFIKDVTNAEIQNIGILASIPTALSVFTVPLIGFSIDNLQNQKLLTTTQVHKLFMCTGFVSGSILLFVTAYFASNFTVSIVCMTLFKVMLSFSFVTAHLVANSLAPQCASVVTGFIDMFYHLSAILNPMLIGFIVTEHSASEWSICYYTMGSFLLIGALLFFIFASSEPQKWSFELNDNNASLDKNKPVV